MMSFWLRCKQVIFEFIFPEALTSWILDFYGNHAKCVIKKNHSGIYTAIHVVLLFCASLWLNTTMVHKIRDNFSWFAHLNNWFAFPVITLSWLIIVATLLGGWYFTIHDFRDYFFKWLTLGKFDETVFRKRLYRFSFLITPYMVKKLLAMTLINNQLECYKIVLDYNEKLKVANLGEKIVAHDHYMGTGIYLNALRRDPLKHEPWKGYWSNPDLENPQTHYFYDFFLLLSRAQFGATDELMMVKSDVRHLASYKDMIVYLMQKEEIKNNTHVEKMLALHPHLHKYQKWINHINLYEKLDKELDMNEFQENESEEIMKI